jgi:hypothetical protein
MGLMVKISKSYCDICDDEKECIRLDDDGPKYENNVIYMCASCLKEGLELLNELEYFCDEKRHIICKPYSIKNLHKMAKALGIGTHWFHKNHYDMPKTRIEEITAKCTLVNSKEIIKIIGSETGN